MPHPVTRKTTRELLKLVEDGVLSAQTVLEAALNYMSEDDVYDMAEKNEFIIDDEIYEDF